MVSHLHTNGNGIYLPAASTSAMFSTTNSIVVVSNSQKQSVSDTFQIVVLPLPAAPSNIEVQLSLQLQNYFFFLKTPNIMSTNYKIRQIISIVISLQSQQGRYHFSRNSK